MTFSKDPAILAHLMWTMALLLLVTLCAEIVSAQSDSETKGGFIETLRDKQILVESLKHANENKIQMDQFFGHELNFKLISDALMSNSSVFQGNYRCLEDILLVAYMVVQKNISALQMLDAWGKPSDGLMDLKLSYLGSYDECLRTRIPTKKGEIKGKYCSAIISFIGGNSSTPIETTLGLLFGTCFPSSCNNDDVQSLLRIVIPTMVVPLCATDDPLPWKSYEIVGVAVISFLALLVVIGTAFDGYVRLVKNRRSNSPTTQEPEPQGLISRVVLCFSAYSNTKKIFDVSNTQGSLGVLHGMRFFSISWVVLCHSYLNVNIELPVNLVSAVMDMLNELGFEIIISGSVSVDTFFFMSGFLVAYVALPQLIKLREKNKRFNIFAFYFHRYWRLTPPLALVIALGMFWTRLGSGPLWTRDPMTESCRKYWWANLIYINNLYKPSETSMCIGQSWYLANDFQFYLISPLFLLLLVRHELLGILVTSLFALESVICTGVITAVNHYPPSIFILPALGKGNNFMSFQDIYVKPYTRIGPYCVGIIAGYIVLRYPKLKLNLLTQLAGWLATGAILLAILFIPYEWNKGTAYTDVEAFFYSSLHRLIWSIGIAWIVIMCATGQGGIIDEFLSWKAFVPLSRLSYMVFLVHSNIQTLFFNSSKVHVYYSNFNVVHWFLSFIVLSYALAYVCVLAFEAPFVGIEKIIFRRPSKSPAESSAKEDIRPVSVAKAEEDCERLTEDTEDDEIAETDNTGFVKKSVNTNMNVQPDEV